MPLSILNFSKSPKTARFPLRAVPTTNIIQILKNVGHLHLIFSSISPL